MRYPLALVILLAACSGDPELTAEERIQKVKDEGTYCCTHDGTPQGPGCDAKPGAVYLSDFESLDPAGRGDACGWIYNG